MKYFVYKDLFWKKKWGVLVKSGGVLVKNGGVLTCYLINPGLIQIYNFIPNLSKLPDFSEVITPIIYYWPLII
jgi:hypothetical protein